MGLRRLSLLRHGQAEPLESSAEDFERPLTKHGTIEAREAAASLLQHDIAPDFILASPAERTWSTANIVAAAFELDAKQVQGARELYLASPEAIWHLVQRCNAACLHVLVCGHNPGLSQLAGRLGPLRRPRELPTGGLVTAAWHTAAWAALEPETADQCDWDDLDTLDDR